MLDSTQPAAVIAAAKVRMSWRGMQVRAAAAYKDGADAWPDSDRTALRNMGLKVVNISVGTAAAEIYDVEAGDWDPGAAAAQMGHDARAGTWPVAYCDRSVKRQVIADLAAEGLGPGLPAGRGFGLWVATLDGTFQDLDGSDLRDQPGVVAVQYAQADSPVHLAGQPPDLDVSVVTGAGEQWLGLGSWQSNVLAALGQIQHDLLNVIGEVQANQ